MKLRHVLLLACAVGACGALLLAWDMHRRLREAERALLLKGVEGGSHPHGSGPKEPANSKPDEANLRLLTVHALGLLSLAFLFLAVFLLLITALRERAFASAVDGELPPTTGPPEATGSSAAQQENDKEEAPAVMTLAEAAQQEGSPATEQTANDQVRQ
ncbi:MAG: hypothetical protein ABSE73_12725 [Planctomycetota bacterium]